jgi:hypothetical protein
MRPAALTVTVDPVTSRNPGPPGKEHHTQSAVAYGDNRVGTGLGDKSRAPQDHWGLLEEPVEPESRTA